MWRFTTNGLLVPKDEPGFHDGQQVRPKICFAINGMAMPQASKGDRLNGDEVPDVEFTPGAYSPQKYPGLFEMKQASLNTSNTEAELVQIEAAMEMQRVIDTQYRKILPVTPCKSSALFYQYGTKAHGSAAAVIDIGVPIPTDSPTKTETRVKILKIAKGSDIPQELATPSEIADTILWLRRMVDQKMAQICYQSNTLPDVDGAIDDAGETDAATDVWSAAPGTSKVYTDMIDIQVLMGAKGYGGPYVVIADTTNHGEAYYRLENAGDGGMNYALDNLPIGDFLKDAQMLHGTVLTVQVDRAIATLALAEELRVVIGEATPLMPMVPIACFMRGSPAIKLVDGVGTTTGA